MQNIAKRLSFQIIYGDTDSLFLNNPPSEKSLCKFQDICNKELDIDLEIKNQRHTLLSQ
jgi:DNA polymerase elongation subunit (family B)